jgi:hypothetical protein
MIKQEGVRLGLIICLLLLVGCSSGTSNGALVENYSNDAVSPQVAPTKTPTEMVAVMEATPEPAPPTQSEEEPATTLEEPDWVSSSDAGNYLGEIVTVRVEVSYCSYLPNVNGSPTFCNDKPYPDHVFTYLMWGVDISRFDQLCVLVNGEIVEYDGKIQIVVESEEQIIPCDG